MEAGVVGLVLVVLVVILSRRLRWDAVPSHGFFLAAAVLFAFSLVAPTIGAMERETGWIVAGALAVAVGFLLLVVGVLRLRRTDAGAKRAPPREGQGGRSAEGRRRVRRRRKARGWADRVPDPFDEEEDEERPSPPPSG